MCTPRHQRLASLLGSLVVLSALLATAALGRSTGDLAGTVSEPVRPAFASTCIGYCKHPTNAAKVFRWGLEEWRQEFETGTLSDHWRSDHPDAIGQQQGMLTVKAEADSGAITVWPDDQAAVTGRWEARIRAFEKSSTGEPYRFTWELVPAGGDDSCGANAIVLATYVPGDARVTGAVRTLPDTEFAYSRKRDLRSRAWHTYAVEVTRDHISWFVDTKVMRTERRPEALAGVKYRPQLVMEAPPDTPMRVSWFQADWVRYYTLKRPGAKSVEAPQMRLTTYVGSC